MNSPVGALICESFSICS
uniref:Uncharacterized protein n=1 Tax=Arundo donax TaxID=35708 RepID=A0A0A9HEW5_ARUDO